MIDSWRKPYYGLQRMSKRAKVDTMGLAVPERLPAIAINFRLKGGEGRKLDELAKRLKVGRSKMARLIVEKFIADHDPDKETR